MLRQCHRDSDPRLAAEVDLYGDENGKIDSWRGAGRRKDVVRTVGMPLGGHDRCWLRRRLAGESKGKNSAKTRKRCFGSRNGIRLMSLVSRDSSSNQGMPNRTFLGMDVQLIDLYTKVKRAFGAVVARTHQ